MTDEPEVFECKACFGEVHPEATRCRHCGTSFETPWYATKAGSRLLAVVVAVVVAGLFWVLVLAPGQRRAEDRAEECVARVLAGGSCE